jgi:DNA-binding transcriptional ArsR family regulator
LLLTVPGEARIKKVPLFKCAANPEVVELSELLKVISDPTRLRILCALFGGEKCVHEVEEGLAISQPLASHHLRALREARLVQVRHEGTWSYYSLNPSVISRLNRLFHEILEEGCRDEKAGSKMGSKRGC